uniref:Uncharacterized protein n=1 Tax=Rhizophora mucronata TaxID=61149 RepID=A0A2P2N4Z8_RHIMU
MVVVTCILFTRLLLLLYDSIHGKILQSIKEPEKEKKEVNNPKSSAK